MAFLRKLLDWVLDLFHAETLIVDDDILLPPPSRTKIPITDPPRWDGLFRRLDELIAIEKIARQAATGLELESLRPFRRRFGSYIYSGSLDDFAPTVQHVDDLGLPDMISVANGAALDALIDDKAAKMRHLYVMVKVTAIKIKKKNLNIERHSGELFEASFLFAGAERTKRWGKPASRRAIDGGMFFSVDRDGIVKALKHCGKHSSLVTELATTHKESVPVMASLLEGDFARAINCFRMRDTNWLVKVEDTTRGIVRATFGIQPLDAPHVFNARMKIRTASGRTRPIFHPVRAHERMHDDGSSSIVRLHHRGLTKFQWRGYACEINIPSWQPKRVKNAGTPILNDFTMSAQTREKNERPEQPMLSSVQVIERLGWNGSDHNQHNDARSMTEVSS